MGVDFHRVGGAAAGRSKSAAVQAVTLTRAVCCVPAWNFESSGTTSSAEIDTHVSEITTRQGRILQGGAVGVVPPKSPDGINWPPKRKIA